MWGFWKAQHIWFGLGLCVLKMSWTLVKKKQTGAKGCLSFEYYLCSPPHIHDSETKNNNLVGQQPCHSSIGHRRTARSTWRLTGARGSTQSPRVPRRSGAARLQAVGTHGWSSSQPKGGHHRPSTGESPGCLVHLRLFRSET